MINIGTIFIIIIVIGWVVKGLSALTGNDQKQKGSQSKGRSIEDWDEMQARRRAEHIEQREVLEELRVESSSAPTSQPPRDLSQMTMAERIELARQRARQQSGGAGQGDAADALRRARERAETEAQRRRQLAEQQRRNQIEQAQRAQAEKAREQQLAQRRRAAEARTKAEREAQQKQQARRNRSSSSSSQRTPQRKSPALQVSLQEHENKMKSESYERVHQGHAHGDPKISRAPRKKTSPGIASLGPLDAVSLRKAFILKEMLDKPIALRSKQNELLS